MTKGFLRFLRGNTLALLALFIALGGTTYAATALPTNSVGAKQLKKNAVTNPKIKNGAVTGAKIANNSVKGADVLESSLGQVPSSASAVNATNATNATHATTANTAAPSGAAGGALTGTYPNPGLAAPEAWHEVGAAGEPAFQNAWVNESPTTETTAAFYKDPLGVIHLKGLITGGANNAIFTLPAGYRPSKAFICLFWRTSGAGQLIIYPTGIVFSGSGTGAGDLDSVTFRADE
jgi:hypothetical protein